MAGVYDNDVHGVAPYYDDFDEDKKFLRMLFRPGYAVQARELTQLQTIIQNQVERFGSHIFEDGSVVAGGQVTENYVTFARVPTGSLENTSVINDFENKVVGLSGGGGALARVIEAVTSDSDTDPFHVLFFDYINGATGFTAGDYIQATGSDGSTQLKVQILGATASFDSLGDAVVVGVDEGIHFVDGFFVKNNSQTQAAYTITGGKKVFTDPSVRIGFDISKTIVDSTSDTTLLDPAFGSPNENAPGANRYKADLTLNQYDFDASVTADYSQDDFIELIRLENGVTTKKRQYPAYADLEDTLARRTYDESGHYTVSPFDLNMSEHGTSAGYLIAGLEPGKAYVFGYEFETIATTDINMERARNTDSVSSYPVPVAIGNYLFVNAGGSTANWATDFDLDSQPLIALASGTIGATGTRLGTARLRQLTYSQAGASGDTYKAYLYDIKMDGTNRLTDVTMLYRIGLTAGDTGNGVTSANAQLFDVDSLSITGGNTFLTSQESNILVFRVPIGNTVSTFGDVTYDIQRNYPNVSIASSKVDVAIGISDPSGSPTIDFSGAAGVTFAFPSSKVAVFDTDSGQSLTGTATPLLPNGRTLHLEFNSFATGTVNVSAQVNVTDVGGATPPVVKRTKTLNEETYITVNMPGTTASDGRVFSYLNGYTDVTQIRSIVDTGNSNYDLSSLITLDTGQRDNVYDWARIFFDVGVTATGPLGITFDYYSHSSEGPFYVDSYSGAGSTGTTNDYESVPTYISSLGEYFELRDCVDFRPRRLGQGSATGSSTPDDFQITNSWVPQSGEEFTGAWTYYLPRTDKLVLTRDREFKVVKGIDDLTAPPPEDDPNGMTLYVIRFNPYTFDETDVQVRHIENKRYTMRDIGKLEKRIEKLEYYQTLNHLEQEAAQLSITDSAGDEKPKNGILVDDFRGHGVGDVNSEYYEAAMDFEKGILRSPFTARAVDMQRETTLTGLTSTSDNIVLLNYTETTAIDQPLSSQNIAVNPFSIAHWLGNLRMSPSSDNWFDTSRRPKVRVNIRGENDAWESSGNGVGFGTQWNNWQINWFGRQVTASQTESIEGILERTSAATREAIAYRVGQVKSGITQTLIPESITKILGNRIVNVSIIPWMRSQTITINAYGMKPETTVYPFFDGTDVSSYCKPSGGSLGGAITTDANGAVENLIFYVPSGVFRTGERLFRLIDSSTNTLSGATTASENLFRAQGLLRTDDDGLVSTRSSFLRREAVKSNKIITNVLDRLRQRQGEQLKNTYDPLAQTFTIREDVFPNGVYLSSTELYFAAKDTGNLPVTVQIRPLAYGGWPHPSRVIPFSEVTLNPSSVNASSTSPTATKFRFSSPVYLAPGSYALTVLSNSLEYKTWIAKLGETRTGTDEERISDQPASGVLYRPQNSGSWLADETEDLMFRLNRCAFSPTSATLELQNSGTTAYGTTAVDSHNMMLAIDYLQPPKTSTTYTITQIGAATPSKRITPNENVPLTTTRTFTPNTTANLTLDVAFSTESAHVSPILDLDRASLIGIQNVINNNTDTDNTSNDYNGELNPIPEGEGVSGQSITDANTASARYITRKVTLEDGFESDDLKVWVNVAKPTNTSIQVFAKLLYVDQESDEFEQNGYIQLTAENDTTSNNENDFREISYVPASGDVAAKYKAFAIKIVMYSSEASTIPRVKEMRAIAIPAG